MNYSLLLWPTDNMDFWKIKNNEYTVNVIWSHNFFEDYKNLSLQFYECGYQTFNEVINSNHDNIKSDMWFLTGIFLIRHSIELGLKSLLCRCFQKNNDIQNSFIQCCHNVSMLFQKYCALNKEYYLIKEEKEWLDNYLSSLEEVDEKSDMFRFPFEDDFLSKFRNKFLDNEKVTNNLLQAFMLIKKCIQKGGIIDKERFDTSLSPTFFVFSSHGIGNCYLWQPISDNGFHVKVTGYSEVIDYIYQNKNISNEAKAYPIMFMFRNTIELCLKRLFYAGISDGVPLNVFKAKRRSHFIKKDLWKNVKPVLINYANTVGYDIKIIDIVEEMINNISSLDKNGDMFRYPTSYSLEYRFDNKIIDISNIYKYNKSLINFLNGCDSMLSDVADYEAEMSANMDCY